MFRYLPEQASNFAADVDWLHNLITDLSVFFTAAICGAMIYFAIKYRKRNGKHHETPRIMGSHLLEIIWTVVPTIICIYIAYYGIAIYREMRAINGTPIIINTVASQWKWDFTYENGKTFNNNESEIVVPVGQPVKFVLQAKDVLHSFFVPAMRVKRDAVPGTYTFTSFTPIKTGEYPVYCAEYCGKDHSNMMARLKVVSQAEYDRWLLDDSAKLAAQKMTPIELGRTLFKTKACNSCHSLDGKPGVGPSWLKLYDRKGKFDDGSEYTADDNYIRESIIEPNKHIVAGFQPNMMPSFAGQLSDAEINGVIAYMRTLDGSQPVAPETAPAAVVAVDLTKMSPVERGKHYFETKLCITCHSLDGSKLIGPSFKDIYGRKENVVVGDKTVEIVVDDAYIKESILNPMAKVVEGYPPAMPPYQGQLDDAAVDDIIEFLKTVK